MTADTSDVRTVFVTAPNAATAETLASTLVDERLAACVSLVPGVTSVFRWDGEVRREAEVLLVVKTTAHRYSELQARVVELHLYDVPEVLALSVMGGYAPYLDWVRAEVEPQA